MAKNLELIERAREAIAAVFADTGMSPEENIDALEELVEVAQEFITALNDM